MSNREAPAHDSVFGGGHGARVFGEFPMARVGACSMYIPLSRVSRYPDLHCRSLRFVATIFVSADVYMYSTTLVVDHEVPP